MPLHVKRVYSEPAESDGRRVLVDRIWPRGLTKEAAKLDDWQKDLAPSTDLRKWFDHDPAKWDEFKRRYFQELADKSATLQPLIDSAQTEDVTLLFAARDEQHNNAVALKEYLEHNDQVK